MAAAATPAEELSKAITVGMSAPPIGVTSKIPNSQANTMKVGKDPGIAHARDHRRQPAPAAAAENHQADEVLPL